MEDKEREEKKEKLGKDIFKIIEKQLEDPDFCIHMLLEVLEDIYIGHLEMLSELEEEEQEKSIQEDKMTWLYMNPVKLKETIERLAMCSNITIFEVMGVLDVLKKELYQGWRERNDEVEDKENLKNQHACPGDPVENTEEITKALLKKMGYNRFGGKNLN